MILDQIKRHGLDREIDIQRTVQRVRARRSGMVHSFALKLTNFTETFCYNNAISNQE